MKDKVIVFPGVKLASEDQRLDPNLSKRFSAEEIADVLSKLESFAGTQALTLLTCHNPKIVEELDNKDLAKVVGRTAAFFLRRAADRVTIPTIRERIILKLLTK